MKMVRGLCEVMVTTCAIGAVAVFIILREMCKDFIKVIRGKF